MNNKFLIVLSRTILVLLATVAVTAILAKFYCFLTQDCQMRRVIKKDINMQLFGGQKYQEPSVIIPPDSVPYARDRKI